MLIPSERPAYRILAANGFFGPDDHLYGQGDCIVFDDEPNEEMEPLNELARTKLREYLTKLDGFAEEVAKKNGRAFQGRVRSLDEQIKMATQDARRISLISGDGGVPLMSAKNERAANVGKIEDDEVPQTGGGKRQSGRKNALSL
jgi:hypothetical protein